MTSTAAERRVEVRPPESERPRYGLLAGLALGLLPAELDQSIFATALPAVVAELGGYGGVVQALRHGVPLVVAGRSEDKPEVAARVAWSGAGLNLRTDRPTQARLRRAVRTVLDRPSYRAGAVRLQQQIAALGDPVAAIAAELDAVIAAHAAAGASSTS
jgi:hypothetical protein